MGRCAVLIGLLLASCKGSGSKPATAGSGSAAAPGSGSDVGAGSGSGAASAATGSGSAGSAATPPAPTSASLAKPLRGPFATIDAYCATRPKGDDRECANTDLKATGSLPAGVLELAAVYDNNDDENHDIGCAVALRTSAGWFVGPASAETCREPSYIELESVDVGTDGAIATITFSATWHTKDFDDEAKYKLTTLCGVRGGAPACTPVFLSQCDAHAPASGCSDEAFELTWTLDNNTATFTPNQKIDDDAIPTGKHPIL
jgi:hypothetical protein